MTKITHYSHRYGRYDPRRRRAWTLASLWLRGYRRIWQGDLSSRDSSIGPWTSELLNGLRSQDIHIMRDDRRQDADGKTGEVFIRMGVHWLTYAASLAFVFIVQALV